MCALQVTDKKVRVSYFFRVKPALFFTPWKICWTSLRCVQVWTGKGVRDKMYFKGHMCKVEQVISSSTAGLVNNLT